MIKCVNFLTEHPLDLPGRSEIHIYNTRNENSLQRLSKIKGNWGNNAQDTELSKTGKPTNTPILTILKRNLFSKFFKT